jgi:hypothetical protein
MALPPASAEDAFAVLSISRIAKMHKTTTNLTEYTDTAREN